MLTGNDKIHGKHKNSRLLNWAF